MKILIITLLWLSLTTSAYAESCEPGQIWIVRAKHIIMRVVLSVGDKTVVDYWLPKYGGWARSDELLSCNEINLVADMITYLEFKDLTEEN